MTELVLFRWMRSPVRLFVCLWVDQWTILVCPHHLAWMCSSDCDLSWDIMNERIIPLLRQKKERKKIKIKMKKLVWFWWAACVGGAFLRQNKHYSGKRREKNKKKTLVWFWWAPCVGGLHYSGKTSCADTWPAQWHPLPTTLSHFEPLRQCTSQRH